MDYVKMWLKSLIKEEINQDQLKSVAAHINKSEEYLRNWVTKTDPTQNQGFSVWLLRGLKLGNIRMEDQHRIKETLERFIELRRANRIADIMNFPHINDLENAIEQSAGAGSKRQGFSGVDPTKLPGVTVLEVRPSQGIVFYKVEDPISLGKIGEGTKWCTRSSYDKGRTAEYYIEHYGHLVVGYKNQKPFIQYNPDYSQVMDVNDVNFKHNQEINPRDLELPPPEFLKKNLPKRQKQPPKIKLIRPVEPKRSDSSDTLTPQQRQLKNWMPFTHKNDPQWNDFIEPRLKHVRTQSTKGRDLDYERRLAASLLKTKNHDFFERMLEGFSKYVVKELRGERSPIVEKAILDKNFADIQQSFGKTATGKGGSLVRDKRAGINGLEYIARYVVNTMGKNWPEFEKKLENDPYNSIRYYNITKGNPDYVTNPLLKDTILFSRMMKEKKPAVPTKEFNATIKDFFTRTRSQWKYGNFQTVIVHVLEPFLKQTKQTVQDVLGEELAQLVARNFFVGRGTIYWNSSKKDKK